MVNNMDLKVLIKLITKDKNWINRNNNNVLKKN